MGLEIGKYYQDPSTEAKVKILSMGPMGMILVEDESSGARHYVSVILAKDWKEVAPSGDQSLIDWAKKYGFSYHPEEK